MPIAAYLLDIEGTTTPIDFVHKVLFPFARARVGEFVQNHFGEIGLEIGQLEIEHTAETTYLKGFDINSSELVVDYLKFLIDADRKSTPLKSIQGKLWQAGYESGELKSQIFDDVPRAFKRWKSAGKTIAIYSSGSVLAQKNLFRYTDHGDLTPFISDYFDTNVGGKRESASYKQIANFLKLNGENILFVSDVSAELDAARANDFQTSLSARPGNALIAGEPSHKVIHSLDELP